MSKILVVSYTPRHESNSAKLLQSFIEIAERKHHITHLDLVETPAPLLLTANLNALLKRNFMGMELAPEETKAVQGADHLTEQLQQCDRIVLAYPLYNFSLPAAVKAWFDVVIQNGKTFKIKDEGGYEGLCHGKKALILMTTGGDFSQEPAKSMNFATPLAQTCMGFMGIESHSISAYGLNQYADKADEITTATQQQIVAYLSSGDFI
ncbi:MAG: hypothetical protein COA43_01625 [Robiginitomaculum sp.]|nr:MAG: hypothetical protein COA43_01625 [Robiginitomaculum sp.]